MSYLEPRSIWPGVPTLTGVRYVQAIGLSVGSGDLSLYTCPTGKKALIGTVLAWNTTVGSITGHVRINDSGTSYRMGANVAVGPGALGSLGTTNCFMLEAGQILVGNATALGLSFLPNIVEFDNTVGMRSVRTNALVNGNNTIYTVPAGKSASVMSPSLSNNQNMANANLFIANESGGSLNYTCYAVPNGQSVGVNFQIAALFAIANNAVNNTSTAPPTLGAGDFLVVNTSGGGAGQQASVVVFEL